MPYSSLENILIVDDQVANLRVLAAILKGKNYKVKKAIDGESALVAAQSTPPDLILLDIKMPNMDGYEVCTRLKNNPKTQDIPVIFISALSEVLDKIKAFEVGGIDYITKPFQEDEVLVRISSQLTIQKQRKLLEKERESLKKEIRYRKETEAILYQSRALISSILNCSLDGIAALEAVRNNKNGQIIDFRCLVVNPVIAIVFNQNPEDLIGKLVFKRFIDKISPDLFPAFIQVVQTGKPLEKDINYNYKNQQKWYHFIAVKLGDGFSITVRDITERKNSELKLTKANKKLEEKTVELQAFSYRVSHDLRNPLHKISGICYCLKDKYENLFDQEGEEWLEIIENESKQMNEIIDDLLILSQLQPHQIQKKLVDLSDLANKIVIQFKNNRQDQKTNFIISPNVKGEGDQRFLKIALVNLLENAYKYSAQKVNPCIEFGVLSPENPHYQEKLNLARKMSVSLEKNNSNFQPKFIYFIKDNGIGFAMEEYEKIFTPFQRLHSDQNFQGTGIGLSIVQRIINLHGGFIWAESEVGQNATFYFTLNVWRMPPLKTSFT